ncbi:hypothetical protein [Novosphingobium sp.]|uniref:hypothetical protein n=1 Tax=Novosphingobium sp. TaxID=1874826 RepID=UPI002628FA84|nr:hypothetical protein [Novosphingobium sp.]
MCIANGGDSPAIHRPNLALKVAHVIAVHSIRENFVSMAFMKMLGASGATISTTAAIFNTIRSAAGQKDALSAAAKVGLDGFPHLQQLCFAVFAVCRAADRPRNIMSHWLWGHASGIPDGVLLIDPTDFTNYINSLDNRSSNKDNPESKLNPSKVMVYNASDFDEVVRRIERSKDLVVALLGLLTRHRAHPIEPNDPALLQLSSEPEIHKELGRQTKDR